MATITGTTSIDSLIGTAADDIFLPLGVGLNGAADFMSGGDGADLYDLTRSASTISHRYIIDDNGLNGAGDSIIGPGALVQTASFGYIAFATALRDGDDLIIVTPYKPHRFRKPAIPSYEITIVDHFAGEAVETMVAGGVTYQLATGPLGSGFGDIMAGTNLGDVFNARGGDDYMTGNDGDDRLNAGKGNDMLFGDNGDDVLLAGQGDDRAYGGTGNDTVKGGGGADFLYLGVGNDIGRGGGGNDYIYGQNGNDRLIGGAGNDILSGGRGDDVMVGGTGSDVYRYDYDSINLGSLNEAGHDIINDRGAPAAGGDLDRIELFGYYAPGAGTLAEAFSRLAFEKIGNDMRMITDGGTGSITVRNQFANNNSEIEELAFNAGYWTGLRFKILDGATTNIGDDRRYGDGTGGERNELLFGTDGDDQVFGNSGTNFIWLGAGADTLIYKESDPQILNGIGGGAVNDIVMDFDVTMDQMDFTEIKGLSMADLTIANNAAGNAVVSWDSNDIEISDIFIELRGVSAAQITVDHFVF
jgi:Ca2+-binding RTX toxin-like protein